MLIKTIHHDALPGFEADEHYVQSAIVATGALNSGSITSGFGTIDIGDSTFTTTGLGTFGTLAAKQLTLGNAASADDVVISFVTSGNSTTITYDQSEDEFDFGATEIAVSSILAGTFTDGTASLTGGNLTGMGNITGSDIDISAGTGDYTTTGLGTFGSLTVPGISRLDGGMGIGADPTVEFRINVEEGRDGNITIRSYNTNGDDTSAAGIVEARGNTVRLLMVGYGDSHDLTRWGRASAGTTELLSISGPLAIGTFGENDLILGTNSSKAITIDVTQDITMEESLLVKDQLGVLGFTTLSNTSIAGSTTMGDDGTTNYTGVSATGTITQFGSAVANLNTTTINGVYTLPQVVGTSEFLVKQSGTSAWEYVNAASLDVATADAVAVTNEAADTETFLGFYTAASGDLPGKTNAALKFNASTNLLSLDGDLTATGTADVHDLIIRTDTANDDPVISMFGVESRLPGAGLLKKFKIKSSIQDAGLGIEFGFDVIFLDNTGGGRIAFLSPLALNDDVKFSFGDGTDAQFEYQTNQSGGGPEAFSLSLIADGTDTGPGNFLIIENGEGNFNFNHANSIDPHLFIHSAEASTTNWLGFHHDRTDGNIVTGAGNLNLTPAGTIELQKATNIGNGTDEIQISATGSITQTGTATATLLQLEVTNNVGFYGTTPVTQNQLAIGVGASVDDVITELQRLGLVRQAA